MTVHLAIGSATTDLSDAQVERAVRETLAKLGDHSRVLAVPPDATRAHSKAGTILGAVAAHYGAALTDVLPALGTHVPMTPAQIARMYPAVPPSLFRVHDWRRDVVTIGEIPGSEVLAITAGIWDRPWPAQLNKLIWQGGHDLILSIGQVVPHEVAGMANGVKNLFIGAGGAAGINESHFIGAAYGMERMMGRAATPVRRLLDLALERFCTHLNILFILTVVGPDGQGGLATRGLFIGDSAEVFPLACALSLAVNFTLLDEQPRTMAVWLDPHEFHTTWLGNKAIYRTRMAIADGGELIVLAPGVGGFGEDPEIDRVIRAYGYRTSPEILSAVRAHEDLRANLSAAAHLIHGSSEGRFRITYCPGRLSRAEIEGVGYGYGDLAEMHARYPVDRLGTGWHTLGGERVWCIDRPALGLWAWRGRFAQ
jgi:nickel-dependent lactate racemase